MEEENKNMNIKSYLAMNEVFFFKFELPVGGSLSHFDWLIINIFKVDLDDICIWGKREKKCCIQTSIFGKPCELEQKLILALESCTIFSNWI